MLDQYPKCRAHKHLEKKEKLVHEEVDYEETG